MRLYVGAVSAEARRMQAKQAGVPLESATRLFGRYDCFVTLWLRPYRRQLKLLWQKSGPWSPIRLNLPDVILSNRKALLKKYVMHLADESRVEAMELEEEYSP